MHTVLRAFIPAFLTAGLLFVLTATGCSISSGPVDPPDTTSINEDIVQIKGAREEGRTRDYAMATWPQKYDLYATWPLSHLRLRDSLMLRSDSVFVWEGTRLYVEANREGTRLLYVLSEYLDASVGTLYEFDLSTGRKRLLRDSTHAVSNAVYLPGSDGEKIVYYSYGSVPELGNDGPTPGYYLLDTETGEDSLLLKHRSPAGPEEIFNGFDVSPDGQTLLYPLQYTNVGRFKPPKVLAYDLPTGTRDTLDVNFKSQFVWLRYGPEGRQVAYGTYPFGALGLTQSGRSDRIGIIDLTTLEKQVLDTGTHREGPSLDLFPQWSPSGRHLVYGSAPVAADRGAIGNYSLYVLKNVN